MAFRLRLALVAGLVASLAFGFPGALALHDDSDEYHDFATEEFESVWERTDLPVQDGVESRTWIWGPGGFSGLLEEPYEEADDGQRLVQYYDKSRMEMPWDEVDPDSAWFITQGLLATELMTGNLQLGDATFEEHEPSERSVAGDPGDQTAPTYAAMGTLIDLEPRETGGVITEVVGRDGEVTVDEDFADLNVTDAEFDDVTNNNIASVFWDFMNSAGTIWDGGQFVDDQPLFENPFFAVGRPLTEAYWSRATVAGDERDVLIQCFERRCLTYTPGNPEGWEVESGNIGQHYYDWRYDELGYEPVDAEPPAEPDPPPPEPATHDVSMTDSSFVDGDLTISAGDTVVWTNTSGVAHTVTANDGTFDSGSLAPDQVFEHTFNEPGTHDYFCAFHVGMVGTVIVE